MDPLSSPYKTHHHIMASIFFSIPSFPANQTPEMQQSHSLVWGSIGSGSSSSSPPAPLSQGASSMAHGALPGTRSETQMQASCRGGSLEDSICHVAQH